MSIEVRTAPREAFHLFYTALMEARALIAQHAARLAREGDQEMAKAMLRVIDERMSTEGVLRMKETRMEP